MGGAVFFVPRKNSIFGTVGKFSILRLLPFAIGFTPSAYIDLILLVRHNPREEPLQLLNPSIFYIYVFIILFFFFRFLINFNFLIFFGLFVFFRFQFYFLRASFFELRRKFSFWRHF